MNNKVLVRVFFSLIITIILNIGILQVKANALTATTSSATGYNGSEVTITVTLSEQVSVISGALSFEYDTTALDLTTGSFNVPGAFIANWDNAKELGAFMFMSTSNVNGTIFTATFKILDTAPIDEYNIKAIVLLTDSNNNKMEVSNIVGSIKVVNENDYIEHNKTGCRKNLTVYIVGVISFSMVGLLLKRNET